MKSAILIGLGVICCLSGEIFTGMACFACSIAIMA
jgi:hypothetical protein